MLEAEDIKKLTEYQLEVFKDVFLTKEDGKELKADINRVQNSLDAVLNDKKTRAKEVLVLTHLVKNEDNFLGKAAPNISLEFKH